MKQIDYLKFISQKVIDASIEDEPVIHNLSGGTFEYFRFQMYRNEKKYIQLGLLETFSDHCDCNTKNKCNKVLPILLSNN